MDLVFRQNYSAGERRQVMPWGIISQSEDYSGRVLNIYKVLDSGRISEQGAIEALRMLMEEYYGRHYPLRQRKW